MAEGGGLLNRVSPSPPVSTSARQPYVVGISSASENRLHLRLYLPVPSSWVAIAVAIQTSTVLRTQKITLGEMRSDNGPRGLIVS